MNIWDKSKNLKFTLPNDLVSCTYVQYPEGNEYVELKKELEKFINWVEANYSVHIPIIIDFVDKYYLVENGKRCGYLFYYQEFENYPEFLNIEDLPYIVVPVKGYNEKWSLKDILGSLVEAFTDYFAWLADELNTEEDIQPIVDEILDQYFK